MEDGTLEIIGYSGSGGTVTIPETIDVGGVPKTVTAIGSDVFYANESITGFSIPSTVTRISSYAFYGSGYYNNPSNWDGDLLYIGDCLVNRSGEIYYAKIKSGTRLIADEALPSNSVYLPISVKYIGQSYGSDRHYVYEGSPEDWSLVDCDPEVFDYVPLHFNGTPETISYSHTPSTCEKRGKANIHCTADECGYETSYDIPVADHQKGTKKYSVAATCSNVAYDIYTCKICSSFFKEYLPNSDPLPCKKTIKVETVAPNCESNGYTLYKCGDCFRLFEDDYTYFDESSTHDRSQPLKTVDPSCANHEGYTEYYCSICDSNFKDYNYDYSLEHTYPDTPTERVEPSCLNEGVGYEIYECTVCHYKFRSGFSGTIRHNYEHYKTVNPTCTKEGYEIIKCSLCGDEYTEITHGAIGHTPGKVLEKNITTTCVDVPYYKYQCLVCNEAYYEIDTSSTTKKHTFSGDSCTVCKSKKSDIIESSHPYEDNLEEEWIIKRAGVDKLKITFSINTLTERGNDFIDIFDKSGKLVDSYSGSELSGKTITVNGDTAKLVFRSDSSISYYGFATTKIEGVCAHNYKQTALTKATCTAAGKQTFKCTKCGYSYSKTLPKKAHTSKITGKKSATYFAKGSTGKTSCSVCGKLIKKASATPKKVLKKPTVTVKAGKKKLTVKYKAVNGATGYQIKYKLSSSKKWITKTYASKKAATRALKSLKAKKKYTVKVRAYVKKGSKKAYSAWFTKSIKTK